MMTVFFRIQHYSVIVAALLSTACVGEERDFGEIIATRRAGIVAAIEILEQRVPSADDQTKYVNAALFLGAVRASDNPEATAVLLKNITLWDARYAQKGPLNGFVAANVIVRLGSEALPQVFDYVSEYRSKDEKIILANIMIGICGSDEAVLRIRREIKRLDSADQATNKAKLTNLKSIETWVAKPDALEQSENWPLRKHSEPEQKCVK